MCCLPVDSHVYYRLPVSRGTVESHCYGVAWVCSVFCVFVHRYAVTAGRFIDKIEVSAPGTIPRVKVRERERELDNVSPSRHIPFVFAPSIRTGGG